MYILQLVLRKLVENTLKNPSKRFVGTFPLKATSIELHTGHAGFRVTGSAVITGLGITSCGRAVIGTGGRCRANIKVSWISGSGLRIAYSLESSPPLKEATCSSTHAAAALVSSV
jgi:hypothetical protein